MLVFRREDRGELCGEERQACAHLRLADRRLRGRDNNTREDVSPTDVSPEENSWILRPLFYQFSHFSSQQKVYFYNNILMTIEKEKNCRSKLCVIIHTF
jgi:hypothetical protein